ncbi:MAG: Arm DNA-binding domain-containing protein [Actinomycetota bacterium]|nr:Arm DNA-binding domain-containing protein [Actinomycetota bacterium]
MDSGRDEQGRRQQKWHGSYRTRKDAEVAKAKFVSDVHNGTYVAPTTRTFAEWVRDSWLPTILR